MMPKFGREEVLLLLKKQGDYCVQVVLEECFALSIGKRS